MIEDGKIVRRHDEVARGRPVVPVDVGINLVGEGSLQRLHRDDVARYEFINAIERCLIGRSVSSNGGVPWLAREWCLWEMTRAFFQQFEINALHHHKVRIDGLHRDSRNGVAQLRDREIGLSGDNRLCLCWRRWRCELGDLGGELFRKVVLSSSRGQSRSPQLIDDEQQNHDASSHHEPPDCARDAPQLHERTLARRVAWSDGRSDHYPQVTPWS